MYFNVPKVATIFVIISDKNGHNCRLHAQFLLHVLCNKQPITLQFACLFQMQQCMRHNEVSLPRLDTEIIVEFLSAHV